MSIKKRQKVVDRFNDPSVSVSLETMCRILGLYTDCEACNDKIQNQIYVHSTYCYGNTS